MNLYLFFAYTLIFTAIFAYIVSLHRRQTRLQERLRRLEEKSTRPAAAERNRER